MWRRFDPLVPLETALAQRPPAKTCCGFWTLETGTHWAVRLLIFEAAAQLFLSFLRPASLWMMTPYVFFCFVTQDITRVIMLAASLWTLRALRRGRGVVGALRLLFRVLVVLAVLELIEMILKLGEEEAICEHDMHNRGDDAVHACEVINDIGEILLSIATVCVTPRRSQPPSTARDDGLRPLPAASHHRPAPAFAPGARALVRRVARPLVRALPQGWHTRATDRTTRRARARLLLGLLPGRWRALSRGASRLAASVGGQRRRAERRPGK